MPYRILIVEDDVHFRDTLRDVLNLEGFSADGIGSVASYRAWRRTQSCDVLIVDRSLPDGDGLDVVELYRQTEGGPVIVVTCDGEPESRVRGMNSDADYYLVKPIVTDELVAILKRLSRRTETVSRAGNSWVLDPITWELKLVGKHQVILTRKEMMFLRCFIEKAGVPVPRVDIIESIGESPALYDPHRMETIVRRLRKKIEASGIDNFPLATIYGGGYVFNGQLSSA